MIRRPPRSTPFPTRRSSDLAVNADVVHGVRDVNEVLEEFARDVFVGHVFFREFQGDGQHIQAIHAHPTGAVGLLEMPAGGKWRGTVENTDVVEAQEAALENVDRKSTRLNSS